MLFLIDISLFRCTKTETIGYLFRFNDRIKRALATGCKTDTINNAKTTNGYKNR